MNIFKRDILIKLKSGKGQSLVELLIAIGLSTLILPALLTGLAAGRGGRAQSEQRQEAVSYLKETQEAVRSIADRSWDNISVNGTYHASISNGQFVLVSGEQNIDGFIINTVISDTYRDGNGAIISAGGNIDPSTKKVVSTVSWNTPFVSNINSISYFTRHKNLTSIDTTVAHFNRGATNSATTGIAVTNSAGGEVTLGSGGGGGDWCKPSQSITTVDLSRQGVPTSVWAFDVGSISGNRVFAGTGGNASGPTFTNTKIIGNSPPTDTFLGQYNNTKANGIFGSNNYAYLATDKNSAEIVILDLNQFTDSPTNQNYKNVGAFDTPGSTDANTVFVLENTGYVITGSTLYNFDVTDKTNPQALDSDGVALAGTGNKIVVIGNYAYVATASTSKQLQIIDVSNQTNLVVVGNLSSGLNDMGGVDVSVNSTATRAYVVTSASAANKEFFIINISNKTSPVLVTGGSYEVGGMNPKGVAVVTGNRAIIIGSGGSKQYVVVDISSESSPVVCGPGLAVTGGVSAISSVLQSDGYAYSYVVTGDAHAELKIILGGAGAGNNHNLTGVFESATFDAGSETAWNKLITSSAVPQSTTLRLKIAIKKGISNSCNTTSFSSTDFVGPDGQSSSFFPSTGGLIPFNSTGSGYLNPGRCAKYRAYLDTLDSSQTPVIYDISLNYSL